MLCGCLASPRNRRNKSKCRKCIGITVSIPLFIIIICLALAIGAAAGALILGVLLLPFYVLHFILVGRTIYWWSKTRIKE